MNGLQASLVVVGTGIKFLSHLSMSTSSYITQSEKVLYSVNDPLMEAWITENNPKAESLNFLEEIYPSRLECYRAMTDYILNFVKQKLHVCVVFYGHPTVFAKAALDAVIEAKKAGYFAEILPAISAEDCLFADLLIDPGSHGYHSYEATDFLLRRRQVDNASHLVLWQVGMIGALGSLRLHDNSKGIILLADYLSRYYPVNHSITAYEASIYPHLKPRIHSFRLAELPSIPLSSLSTLYIPPSSQAKIDSFVLKMLNIEPNNIK